MAPDTRYKQPSRPVKRWQARDYGALWQYDATRFNTGARLYPKETLLIHFDFLSRVFQTHGLPLTL